MIKVISNNLDQVSILENMLIQRNIYYEVRHADKCIGINEPYLEVDGVPLDMGRAIKYIEGKKENG